MPQATKSELWKELKDAGVTFPNHYRDYNTETLQAAVTELRGRATPTPAPTQLPPPIQLPPPTAMPQFDAAAFGAAMGELTAPAPRPAPEVIVSSEPDTVAGLRQNTHQEDQPHRIDPETGYEWFRDEVRKAAYPKPRGRRVHKYMDPGTKETTIKSGEYTETFEMPGDQRRASEARITLPSYQVGLYRDPRFPQFRIHIYGDETGFDFEDVQKYYGGPEQVPADVKRKYVENVLCYDTYSLVRAIETEYRERILGAKS